MSIKSSIRYGLARLLVKSAGLPIVPQWVSYSFLEPSFARLVAEGYKKNAAFLACVSAYTFSFPEPPLMVYDGEGDDARPIPNHPLRLLLRRPNKHMGEDRLMRFAITYMAIGGNAYLHKTRDQAGRVIGLWPYHAGQMIPVPSTTPGSWVEGYDYDNGSGVMTRIPVDDIIHLQWPTPDPSQPWMAMPPLQAGAGQLDTDNEITRYCYALIKNDATPRTILQAPKDVVLDEGTTRRMKEQFRENYGGNRRGDIAILEDGITFQRVSLDLQQMAFDALHKMPEARLAAIMRVPPIVAGLSVGLDNATYSNYGQAREAFTRDSLVPLWGDTAAQVQAGFVKEPGFEGVAVAHDLNRVKSLQQDLNDRWKRVNDGYNSGWLPRSRVYALLNLPQLTTEEIAELDAIPDAPAPQRVPPRALPAPPKQLGASYEIKILLAPQKATRRLLKARQDVAHRMEKAVDRYFADLADRVIERAAKGWRPTLQTKALPAAGDLLTEADEEAFGEIVGTFYTEIASASWETWNQALGVEVAFDLEDPAVQKALALGAEQVKDITITTKTAIRELLQHATAEGWSLEQLLKGDDTRPGLRSIVKETYKGRATTIARTEIGNAQQSAAVERYRDAGVDGVKIFDGGSDDSDEECNQLDGTVQTLDWAEANLLGHPNCVRCFAPHFSEE